MTPGALAALAVGALALVGLVLGRRLSRAFTALSRHRTKIELQEIDDERRNQD